MEHASVVWDNITQEESEQLEGLQRRALLVICGSKLGSSHEQLYNELDLPTLAKRHWALRLCKM